MLFGEPWGRHSGVGLEVLLAVLRFRSSSLETTAPRIRDHSRRIQQNGALVWKKYLQSRNLFEIQSEDMRPVSQPVIGESAKREQLMKARAESLRPKFVVEIVGKNEGRGMAEHGLRILRNGMEVEVPGRENRPDATGEFSSGWRTRLRTHPFGPRFLLSAGTGGRGKIQADAISPTLAPGPPPQRAVQIPDCRKQSSV